MGEVYSQYAIGAQMKIAISNDVEEENIAIL